MTTIGLVTSSRHDADARQLRERLAAAWPARQPDPTFMLLHAGDPMTAAPGMGACIVLHPEQIGDTAVMTISREMRAAHVPLISIGEDRDPRLVDAHAFALAASPESIASFLAGLAIRTPAVRQLEESLRYAFSVHESAARMLDQFQDDQLIAASIQRQFVSQELPALPDLACAALFRPIDFLSGDIYHVSRLDDEHLGFFLADAMGHGLPAALMSLYIAGRITQRENDGGGHRILAPSESLTRLNRDLCVTGCSNVRFATAVCGTLHVPTGRLHVAAAGHPPALIMGRTGTPLKKVDAGGPLLGAMDDTSFDQADITLERGQTLILYSDGLEDSLNPPGQENKDAPRTRHLEFLDRVATEIGEPDPEKMFASFAALMDSETGSMHQVDDVTLVGIRRSSLAA